MQALLSARDVSREKVLPPSGLARVSAEYLMCVFSHRAAATLVRVVTLQVPDAEMLSTFVPAQAAFEVRAGLSRYKITPLLLHASSTAVHCPGLISFRGSHGIVAI